MIVVATTSLAPQRSEQRAPSSYDEARQLYFKGLQGSAWLCGAHLPNIEMVARISARPYQNNLVCHTAPP